MSRAAAEGRIISSNTWLLLASRGDNAGTLTQGWKWRGRARVPRDVKSGCALKLEPISAAP